MKLSLMARNGLKQLVHGFQRPFMMMFETTLHCNMACEYCTVWSNDRNEKIMTQEQAFRRIDEAIDLGIFALSFSGGEPLLNPNTADYIVYGADRGLFVSMPTNGLALRKYATALQRLDLLEVSIDTLDEKKFAKRRGLDSLKNIIEQLDYLIAHHRPRDIQLNAAVNLENLDDLPALAAFADERGIHLHTEAVHNVMRYGLAEGDGEMTPEEIRQVELFLNQLKKEHKSVRFYSYYYKFYRDGGFSRKFACRSASHLINLKPDGTAQFPCSFVMLHRGNANMTLQEIFRSPEVRALIKKETDGMWDFCKGCKIGCPFEVSLYTHPLLAIQGTSDFWVDR